jgi:hypothetical protein
MRKNKHGGRVGWADLIPSPVQGGVSPIEEGAIPATEACGHKDGIHLIYDETTDTIYSLQWEPGNGFGSPPDMVVSTLDQYDPEEL